VAGPFQGLLDPKGCAATGTPHPAAEDRRRDGPADVAPDASAANDDCPGKVSCGQGPSQRVEGDDAANAATGLYRMKEDALLRLEKGLRTQREQQRLPHRSVLTAPGICPGGDGKAAVEFDQVSLQPRISQSGTTEDFRHADQRPDESGPAIAERERRIPTAVISPPSSSLPKGARSSAAGRGRLTLFLCAVAIAIGGADLSYQLWRWTSRSSDLGSVKVQTAAPAKVPQATEVPIPKASRLPQASEILPTPEAPKDANTSGKPIASDERSPKVGFEPPSTLSNAQSVETGGAAEPAASDLHTTPLTPSASEIKKSRPNPKGRRSRNGGPRDKPLSAPRPQSAQDPLHSHSIDGATLGR
jgi:hypothetical protein